MKKKYNDKPTGATADERFGVFEPHQCSVAEKDQIFLFSSTALMRAKKSETRIFSCKKSFINIFEENGR